MSATLPELMSFGDIDDNEKAIIKELFEGYDRVVAKREFTSGRSGSRVFLAVPIRPLDRAELECVIKVDTKPRIEKEWLAFREYIQHRLPGIAAIDGQPVFHEGNPLGALRYPLAGNGVFPVQSFWDFCWQADTVTIVQFLESRLFRSMMSIWQKHSYASPRPLRTVYDSFLKPNLDIEYDASPVESVTTLLPETAVGSHLALGAFVELRDFMIIRVFSHELILDKPSRGYQIRIQNLPDTQQYREGDTLDRPLYGRVVQTRQKYVREQVESAFGTAVNLDKETFSVGGVDLPNPLTAVGPLLNKTRDGRKSIIHADLNMQNILVESDTGNPHLIDFVNSREDHVLLDLLHMEMSFVNEFLPVVLQENYQLSPAIIVEFYQQLHCVWLNVDGVKPIPQLEKPFFIIKAIRQAATALLVNSNDRSEYYEGLYLYVMGAYRYKSVRESPLSRQVLFYCAATLAGLIDGTVGCESDGSSPQASQDGSTSAGSTAQPSRQRHVNIGSVYGPVNVGGQTNIDAINYNISSAKGLDEMLDSRVLYEQMKQYFDMSELDEILFFMKIDREYLAAQDKPSLVREMIQYCQRRGMLPEMVAACRTKRPSVNWGIG